MQLDWPRFIIFQSYQVEQMVFECNFLFKLSMFVIDFSNLSLAYQIKDYKIKVSYLFLLIGIYTTSCIHECTPPRILLFKKSYFFPNIIKAVIEIENEIWEELKKSNNLEHVIKSKKNIENKIFKKLITRHSVKIEA